MAKFHKPTTRKATKCPVFGAPSYLPELALPTYEDIIKFCLHVRHDLKSRINAKVPTVAEISEIVATKTECIWRRASIPVVSHVRVLKLIRSYYDKYSKLLHPFKGRKTEEKYKLKLQNFRTESRNKLFDIAACKCTGVTKCGCNKLRKVPTEEQPFLADQRSMRLMIMSGVDQAASVQLKKNLERKRDEAARAAKRLKLTEDPHTPQTSNRMTDVESDDELPLSVIKLRSAVSDSSSSSDDEQPLSLIKVQSAVSQKTHSRLLKSLPTLAQACDRHRVSDRCAAAIASATLQDFGLIREGELLNVVDRCKIRRARQRKRTQLQNERKRDGLRSIYFDGRKDKTIVIAKDGLRYRRRKIVQEHLSLIQEPGSKYIGHVTPETGSAKDITKSIIDFLQSSHISVSDIVVVGCDGTNVNTGRVGGAIRLLEEELKKPLQWFVCLLHANELPLRHLMEHLDGSTTGPRAFAGIIGKSLSTCEQLPIIAFESIDSDNLIVTVSDLSTDQQYMLEMFEAVRTGSCSEHLSKRDPGPLSHSRWLTAANRLLRLYVSTINPSKNLKDLVMYIMKVYTPMWFQIKCEPSCKNGSIHLWNTIRKSRYLSDALKAVVNPVIQRNAFFGHPENILLAMISDMRKHIRELGVRRILRARSESYGIRRFTTVPINFEADDYIDLIDWQAIQVTEPPILADIASDELEMFVASGDVPCVDFAKFPSHTQSVERCVKIVTEASMAVCGAKARDGLIRNILESRENMPYFETKADYKLALPS